MGIWRAERTGVAEIDAVISAYLDSSIERYGDYDLPVADLTKPWAAEGLCMVVATHFAEFAREHGLEAESLSEEGWMASGPSSLGYGDRSVEGLPQHDVAYIEHGQDIFQIDFTAAQYGYTMLPLIQRLDESGVGAEGDNLYF